MTVVDASVVVDSLVTDAPIGDEARRRLHQLDALHAPAILTAETASALRRMARTGALGPRRATEALEQALGLRIVAYPFEPFATRAWELRDVLTVYDAWYVAVAEALEVPLLTADGRIGRASGLRCPVEVIAAGSASGS